MSEENKETSLQPTKQDKQITEYTKEGQAFALIQRKAAALAKSDFMPKEYHGNIAKCIIAIELSERLGATVLSIAQNLYEVYGKPAWASSFVISCINSHPRFKNGLKFEKFGKIGTDERGCFGYAVDSDGDRVEGPPATIEMAKKEGWYGKNGSKWPTMGELMLMYRAATFFGRCYTPEVMNGMHTREEIEDINTGQRFDQAKRVSADDLPSSPFAEDEKTEAPTDDDLGV